MILQPEVLENFIDQDAKNILKKCFIVILSAE